MSETSSNRAHITLSVDILRLRRGNQTILREIQGTYDSPCSLCITGPNGSGKSTLLLAIAHIIPVTRGTIEIIHNSEPLETEEVHARAGFSSPAMQCYNELSALEHMDFVSGTKNREQSTSLLNTLNLYKHRNKPVKHFSSGMKQRLKLACAFSGDPDMLLLDEPSTNLDTQGKDILYRLVEDYKKNRLIVLATNEPVEMKLCSREVSLDPEH